MQANEKPEFVVRLKAAMDYYGKDTSDFAISMFWEGCRQFELEQFSKALTAHVTDPEAGKFAPKISDIVKVLAGTKTDNALLAWGKAFDAMGRVGSYTDVVFDDPAIHAVISDLGGWVKVCRSDMKDLSYLQHRFCESYKAYSKHEGLEYPRILMGDRSPDSEYEKKGLKPPKPTVIGDLKTARLVWSKGSIGSKTSMQVADLATNAIGYKA